MVNPHDVHEKGSRILSMGADVSKIQGSVAMELAVLEPSRTAQLKANKDLVATSNNQLAPVTSKERYLSLGSSHLSQFCKAVCANCTTSHPDLVAKGEKLTLDSACQSQGQFYQMCTQGWQWDVLKCQVEEALPALPALVQAALNTGDQVSSSGNEVAVMFGVCQHYKWSKSAYNSLHQAAQSRPSCEAYLTNVAHYVWKYGGGEDQEFPLIRILDHVSSQVADMIIALSAFHPCLFQILYPHEVNASRPPSTLGKAS